MATIPADPKIYHITHLRNLSQIMEAGRLGSDAKRIELQLNCDVVGMAHFKRRRLREIEVACHAGTHVGDYVPFYLCPRSIMLYIVHKGNHHDLNYTEGQRPIGHLRADLQTAVRWACKHDRRWAFSDCNAGSRMVEFFSELRKLDQLNWPAIAASDWSEPTIKEGKHAEFLVHASFPGCLVERVGVCEESIAAQVGAMIATARHKPVLAVEPEWCYR